MDNIETKTYKFIQVSAVIIILGSIAWLWVINWKLVATIAIVFFWSIILGS